MRNARTTSTHAAAQAPAPRHAGAGSVRIIGGAWRGSKLRVPAVPGLRPTPDRVRETVFNWLGQQLAGMRCLDLFAGSGALGMEAASRGAARVDLVERHAQLAQALQDAARRLGADHVHVHTGDAMGFLARCPAASFDVVFIDPPFAASGAHEKALAGAARVLDAHGRVYLEAPDAASLQAWASQGWRLLRSARAGHVHYALLQRDDQPPAGSD